MTGGRQILSNAGNLCRRVFTTIIVLHIVFIANRFCDVVVICKVFLI